MTKKKSAHHDDAEAYDDDESVTHVRVRFEALDAPGGCPIPEVIEGDVLLWLLASDGHAGNAGNPAFFESIVTVDGELQQNVPLAGHSFDAIFLRGVE